jgi:hypothetical protein
VTRETKEGWPLPTVETEVNGDSKSTTWLVCWAVQWRARDLTALVGPVQNIFFLTVHYFDFFFPIAQQPGQAAVLGRLSLSMCLWGLQKK